MSFLKIYKSELQQENKINKELWNYESNSIGENCTYITDFDYAQSDCQTERSRSLVPKDNIEMMNKFLLLILLVIIPFPESEWKLKKEKDGIIIHTRSIEGSSFDEFRGITTIENSSLEEVLSVIFDVKNFGNLFPDCINPKVIKQEGKYYNIHYIQVKAPWPVKNRDSVYEEKAVIDKNGKRAVVSLNPLPDTVPENKDFVRIREGSGFWELEEDESKNVKVIYQFHGEPGGDIPAWLANSFVVTQPFETLVNLKNRLKIK